MLKDLDMKKVIVLLLVIFSFATVFSQTKSDLQKVVETEKAFAAASAEKGTRSAFLEFLADDGIVFAPEATNGKATWTARGESVGLLSWQPIWADISASGVLGYTTGDWEFRPRGKDDNPISFGQYITIWLKQADGNFKAVLAIGISHPKPEKVETDWKSPNDAAESVAENKPKVSATANLFFDTAADKGLRNSVQLFAADDMRLLRQGKLPILGKKNAMAEIRKEKSSINFGKKMTLQSSGDLAYLNATYQMKKGDNIIEQGNIVQIWKLRGGKWQIVLSVFVPI